MNLTRIAVAVAITTSLGVATTVVAASAAPSASERAAASGQSFTVKVTAGRGSARQIAVREPGGAEVSLATKAASRGRVCVTSTVSAPRDGVRAGKDWPRSCERPAALEAQILPLCSTVVGLVLPLETRDTAPRFTTATGRTGRLAVARTLRPTTAPRLAVGIWKAKDLPVQLRESGGVDIGTLDPMAKYCS